MSINMACPQCGNTCTFPDGSEGRKARCKNCQQIFVVSSQVQEKGRAELAQPVEDPRHFAPGPPPAPKRPRARVHEEEDFDDEEPLPVHRPEFPRVVQFAGVTWIVFGTLILLNAAAN